MTGASGQVGTELVAELERRRDRVSSGMAIEVVGVSHADLDITAQDEVIQLVRTVVPDAIIHCAAFTAVDACESEAEKAFEVNGRGTGYLAEAADEVGAHLCYLSTDYVFDGTLDRPYRETDPPNPMSVYGRSKLAGEQTLDPSSTIARISWVCGRYGNNMVKTILRIIDQSDGPLRFVDDQHGCPTIVSDLVPMLIDLTASRQGGIFHVTNQGPTTWYEFVRAIVEYAGGDPTRVEPIATKDLVPPRPAPRPMNSVLDHQALVAHGFTLLPDWHEPTQALVRALR